MMKMKLKDPEKLKRARNLINLLLEGINPLTFEPIEDESFINDPKMIRIFSYISLVLNQDLTEALLEDEEKDVLNSDIFTQRVGDQNNPDYKKINEKIKSSKISLFSKLSSGDELKKLAEVLEKETSG
ncbi:hypothetical protein EZV73_00925 [Acidaminobacter sp. JC074]|uniref:hypothetical protein n=1 Tax=Acidaminobacter sp. JC074 TaxID=2530199 RepID=UPI001F0D8D33|nr:hypothetical protein [Acidaminobacter sp. JC074]MCH4886104.1 hypothetical protein [Acidaminobacter sp. JC074]